MITNMAKLMIQLKIVNPNKEKIEEKVKVIIEKNIKIKIKIIIP